MIWYGNDLAGLNENTVQYGVFRVHEICVLDGVPENSGVKERKTA
jgi:hypothetical protein